MKRWLLAGAAAVLMISAGHAQQVMDGSHQVLPPQIVAALKVEIGAGQIDPYGAELDRLALKRAADGTSPMICGRVNYRNEYGGFVGFRPFSFSPASGELVTGDKAADRGC